jgi:3-methylcrotonyl-CoA carboxylase alpha subunit
VTTNLAFLKALIEHPQVARGDIDTGFIEREISALTPAAPAVTAFDMAAACAAALAREALEASAPSGVFKSPWDRRDGWMLYGRRPRRMGFRHGAQSAEAVLCYDREGLSIELAGTLADTPAPLLFHARADGEIEISVGELRESVWAAWSGRDLDLTTGRGQFHLHWIDPFAGELGEAVGAGRIVAPMPGTVIRVLAEPGVDLPAGAPLLVIEAMKMEHTLRAPAAGHLKGLKCAVGDFVQEGAELADFEPVEE